MIQTIQQQQSLTKNLTQIFKQSINEDIPIIKLYKFKYFVKSNSLSTKNQLLNEMLTYALDRKFLGDYQELHEIIKRPIQKVSPYKQLRQEMIEQSNKIRIQLEHAESIGNFQETAYKYFQLAEFYRKYTMHKQSTQNYSKLFRTQSQFNNKIFIKKQAYFTQWAEEVFLRKDYSELSVFLRNEVENMKKIDCNLALIKDLKLLEIRSNRFFQNLLDKNFQLDEFYENSIISFQDLSFLYSLSAIAMKQRQFLKNRPKFSAQLEFLYLKNDFRTLLNKIQQIYENSGRFNPFIDKIYGDMFKKVKQRVLRKYLSFYTQISFQQIEADTTFREGEVRNFLLTNPDEPYLIDPVTSSVIYYPKSISLYQQVIKYSCIVQKKYQQKMRVCLLER